MIIDTNPLTARRNYVRTILDHVDRVTEVHHVFACVAASAMYRGSFDAAAPGRIARDSVPDSFEFAPRRSRSPGARPALPKSTEELPVR
jgi:hypothetical protein